MCWLGATDPITCRPVASDGRMARTVGSSAWTRRPASGRARTTTSISPVSCRFTPSPVTCSSSRHERCVRRPIAFFAFLFSFFLFASYDDSATGAGWSQMLRFRCQRTSLTCGIQSASACAAPTLFKAILKVLRSLNLLGRYPTRQGGRLRCVGPPWHLPCSVLVVVGLAITTI